MLLVALTLFDNRAVMKCSFRWGNSDELQVLSHLGLISSNAPLELSGGSPCPPKIVPPSFTGTCENKGHVLATDDVVSDRGI